MKPRLSILDKRFSYRDAASTDVAATFRRIRRELAAAAAAEAAQKKAPVTVLKRAAK